MLQRQAILLGRQHTISKYLDGYDRLQRKAPHKPVIPIKIAQNLFLKSFMSGFTIRIQMLHLDMVAGFVFRSK